MNQNDVIEKTVRHLKDLFSTESSGHDWWHIYRVWKLSLQIASKEKGADIFIVQLGALLHDIADWKFHNGDESVGPKAAQEWLQQLNVDTATITHVTDIVSTISFKGAGVETPMKSLEGKIVQDADRLDAIGALGIARAFAYGGYKGRALYDPDTKPLLHQSAGEYKKNTSSSVNHFYEKLLLLKDRMNTQTAKQRAEHRHQFMVSYLEEFFEEWEGEK